MKTNQVYEINVKSRSVGKAFNSQARQEKMVPSVLYGPKIENKTISSSASDLRRYMSFHYDNTIFTLRSEEKDLNNIKVMIKAKDVHPVKRSVTHVDFYAIDMTQTIRVQIELRFVGKAAGIAEGGMLQAIARDVEVECLPDAIPEYFEVDVSPLGVHESIHASDLNLPEGVKLITDPSVTLVTVTVVKEEAAAPAAAEATAAAVEPEVMAKGKAAKEGEEGAAEATKK